MYGTSRGQVGFHEDLFSLVLGESMLNRWFELLLSNSKVVDCEHPNISHVIIEELISAYHVVKKLPFSTAVLRSLQIIQASPPRQSRSGLDLMQVSGFTVVADKLNQVCCAVVSFYWECKL